MQFFIDTANIAEIREARALGVLDGVTTNPTLMAKQGGDWRAVAREICREVGDYVTMQLFEELLKDEEGHIDFLETQLDLLGRIGLENYGQLNAESGNEAEGH